MFVSHHRRAEEKKKKKKGIQLPKDERALSAEEDAVCGTCITQHSMIAGCVLILSNFIATLIVTESVGHMQRSFDVKVQAYLLFRLLPEPQQQLLLQSAKQVAVPVIKDMVLFSFAPHYSAALQALIEEVSYHLDDGFVNDAREEERRRQLQEEEAAEQRKKEVLEAEVLRVAALTPAQRRMEKRKKFEEQRRRDNALRAETSRQRKILYDLIQTDQISHVFEAEAKGSAKAAEEPEWGKQHDERFHEARNAMKMLSSSFSHKQDLMRAISMRTSAAASMDAFDEEEEAHEDTGAEAGARAAGAAGAAGGGGDAAASVPLLASSISSLSGGNFDESSRAID